MDTTTRLLRALGWAIVGALAGAALSWAFGESSTSFQYGGIGASVGALFGFVKAPGVIETAEEEEAGRMAREQNVAYQRRVFGKAVGDAVSPPGAPHGSFDEDL